MASSQQSESSLTGEEMAGIVNDVVLYLLGSQNSLNLIKRQDISKNILKERKKHFIEVMKLVKTRMLEDFGFELVETEPNKTYALVNILDTTLNSFPNEVEADRIVIILVLTFIFMNNGVMTEDAIIKILKRCKIKSERHDKKHEFFGDAENTIKKKLTRWSFLECSTIPGTDPPLYEFRWGRRAEEQVSKQKMLEFACQERLALALHFLASGDSYTSLQYLFKISKQAISSIAPEGCEAIIEVLKDKVKVIGDTTPENWGKQYAEAKEQTSEKVNPQS